MNVTTKISVDLTRPNVCARVDAVQGDGNTRYVEVALLSGGNPWEPPDGVEPAVAYRKPDYTKGLYNKLANGDSAITISGNVATIILAPQMLTTAGTVQAVLMFNDAQLNRLTTFPFSVSVAANPGAGAQKSEDYIRLQWLEDKLDEYIGKIEGGVTDEAVVHRIVDDYLAANPPTVTETDPTVPAWAKQPEKPTYTAAEVGALPDTYTPPNQTAQQVGADPAGTATTAVSQHNTNTAAHNDLRFALQELSNRVNAALDSDDTTLDQMSEVVAYIKSNKSLIDAITTSKVSITDIVNDLVTNVADKPLSAAQGVVLKGLIDALSADKLDAAELTDAIDVALAQAKTSGEFDGEPGTTPNIQIGTVETLEAGSPATAFMGGTPENPILNLGIPQGAPGSGGGGGIAVTGATVGQTIRVAAVDDDGVPTAWEPVDFPSGGGASIVCVQTELVSGIIPSGEAAWTGYDLGITLADIQEWDEVLVEWYGMTTLSYWSFRPHATGANDASWLQGSSKQVYLYEWVDSAHTCMRVRNYVVGLGGSIGGIVNSGSALNSNQTFSCLCIADWSSINPSAQMTLMHNVATNADITYKVWGITKKEA